GCRRGRLPVRDGGAGDANAPGPGICRTDAHHVPHERIARQVAGCDHSRWTAVAFVTVATLRGRWLTGSCRSTNLAAGPLLLLAPGRALCHYTVNSQLGAGAMGAVYEATDDRL